MALDFSSPRLLLRAQGLAGPFEKLFEKSSAAVASRKNAGAAQVLAARGHTLLNSLKGKPVNLSANLSKPALLLLACATPALAQPTAPTPAAAPAAAPAEQPFAFVLPWDDASRTVIDASALNPAPLDEARRLRSVGGHFRDATGRRVRLLGVNITAGAAFPAHEDAARVAARLHKFGVNCVRLHHMDAPWAQPNLFFLSGGSAGKPTAALSPESLDRLDFFVAQLKQNGIYVDLNLHVSRAWDAAGGFEEGAGVPPLGKVLAYFEPHAIALQQQFATQILTHLNPYTGLSYAREPAVAFVEMNNEDSLLGAASSIATLPASYQSTLQAQWNAWLGKRYGSSDKLLAVWNREAVPLGENFFPDGRLAAGSGAWALEQHEGTKAELSVEDSAGDNAPGDKAPAGRVLKLSPSLLDGTDWHLQLHRTGLNLKDEQLYTVSFAARASTSRSVGVNVRLDQDPWTNLGLDERVALSPAWKSYEFSFRAQKPLAGHTRFSLVAGGAEGDVYVADVALREGGGSVALEAGQNLEASNLPLTRLTATTVGRDWAQFLMDVEASYVEQMRSTIRATGSTAPLLCSQASYGGLGGVWRESRLDIVDSHAYWQHPNFPHRAWDMDDYLVANTSMTREEGGTLSGLAEHRVEGKPFTVTEYDHPAPSEYAAEEVPMLLATAAWQDWDGVFFFEYGSTSASASDRLSGFFNHASHPAKWAFLPSMARLWLGGQLSPAAQSQVLVLPGSGVASVVAAGGGDFWRASLSQEQFSPRSLREIRSSVRFGDATAPVLERGTSSGNSTSSSNLSWRTEAQGAGSSLLQFACPQAVGATGFLGGRRTQAGPATFEVEPSARNFASLTLAALDSRPLAQSRSLLLTAIDKAENAGLGWNAARTFASNSWQGPVQAYGVQAKISLPLLARAAQVFALDATGARRAEIASRLEGGRLSFDIAPRDATVWYEIAAS